MQHKNINSGAEYAQLLIDQIISMEKETPETQQMPINLLTHWCNGIEEKAEEIWLEYITGKRDSYLLSDVEMKTLFDEAGMKYVNELLDGMVDNDVLETYIDDKGEILYGLTENGKKLMMDDIIKNNGKKENNTHS